MMTYIVQERLEPKVLQKKYYETNPDDFLSLTLTIWEQALQHENKHNVNALTYLLNGEILFRTSTQRLFNQHYDNIAPVIQTLQAKSGKATVFSSPSLQLLLRYRYPYFSPTIRIIQPETLQRIEPNSSALSSFLQTYHKKHWLIESLRWFFYKFTRLFNGLPSLMTDKTFRNFYPLSPSTSTAPTLPSVGSTGNPTKEVPGFEKKQWTDIEEDSPDKAPSAAYVTQPVIASTNLATPCTEPLPRTGADLVAERLARLQRRHAAPLVHQPSPPMLFDHLQPGLAAGGSDRPAMTSTPRSPTTTSALPPYNPSFTVGGGNPSLKEKEKDLRAPSVDDTHEDLSLSIDNDLKQACFVPPAGSTSYSD